MTEYAGNYKLYNNEDMQTLFLFLDIIFLDIPMNIHAGVNVF